MLTDAADKVVRNGMKCVLLCVGVYVSMCVFGFQFVCWCVLEHETHTADFLLGFLTPRVSLYDRVIWPDWGVCVCVRERVMEG